MKRLIEESIKGFLEGTFELIELNEKLENIDKDLFLMAMMHDNNNWNIIFPNNEDSYFNIKSKDILSDDKSCNHEVKQFLKHSNSIYKIIWDPKSIGVDFSNINHRRKLLESGFIIIMDKSNNKGYIALENKENEYIYDSLTKLYDKFEKKK